MVSELDNKDLVKEVDQSGMLELIRNLPNDVVKAYEITKELSIPKKVEFKASVIDYTSDIDSIVVTGMGGSAIGGMILEELLRDKISIPIIVSRNYTLPNFVNEKTLVFTISYSGNTEETLSSFVYALKKKCKIFAVTTDGLLQDFCSKIGIPVVNVPKGYPSRAAIAYLTVPMIAILEKLNLVSNVESQIKDTFENMNKLKEKIDFNVPTENNPIKKLALDAFGKFIFVYSYWPYASVALRWKTQINENSKLLAKSDEIPEMNHNEIMGWEGFRKQFPTYVIILRGSEESKEIKTRIEFFENLMKEKEVPVSEIYGAGSSRLSQIFTLIYQGDYFSYYLALLNKVDPTPVKSISNLKSYLKEKVNKVAEIIKEFEELTK